jgi:hypothetical protein
MLTVNEKNSVDNCIAFAHAYHGQPVFSNGVWFEFVVPHCKYAGKDKENIKDSLILFLNCHFYKDMVLPVWEIVKDEGLANAKDIDKPQYAVFKRVYMLKTIFEDDRYKSFINKMSNYMGKPDEWVANMGTKTHLTGFADNTVSSIKNFYILRINTESHVPYVAGV